jgi:hypothetical protein
MAAHTWGRIRLTLRVPGGAAAELRLDAAELIVGDARLAAARDGLDLRVPLWSTQRLWLVRGGRELRGLHLVDATGGGAETASPTLFVVVILIDLRCDNDNYKESHSGGSVRIFASGLGIPAALHQRACTAREVHQPRSGALIVF